MAMKITADCINCGACIDECPNSAIIGDDKNPDGAEIHYIFANKCDECGGGSQACVDVCPSDAIVK